MFPSLVVRPPKRDVSLHGCTAQESTSHARLVEAEVQRARQKREADEELIGQAPEDPTELVINVEWFKQATTELYNIRHIL